MPTFKTNLKQLMLQKSVELGNPITQRHVSEATGLSIPTIGRWYKGTIDRIEIDTVSKLMDFLGCTFSEIVEYSADKAN